LTGKKHWGPDRGVPDKQAAAQDDKAVCLCVEVELAEWTKQQTGRLLAAKYADRDSGSELRAANGRRTIPRD
jgi:hypothetical protein